MLIATHRLWAAAALATLVALEPCVLAPCLSRAAPTSPHPLATRLPHADTVTGSYGGPNKATLDVLELPGGRIQFDLQAYGNLSSSSGPNMGEASGVVALHHGLAAYQYQPDDPGGLGGRMAMRFHNGKVRVSEYGFLGFGAGVSAAGTYVRHSRKPPKFDKSGTAI